METENQKLYELAYFLSPEINESEIFNYAETVRKFISESGGKITSEAPAQKKRIGQPMKKFNFGYFGIFNFQSEPAGIDGLKNNLKLEPKILRHMIVAKKPISAAKEKPVLKTARKPKIAGIPALAALSAALTEKPVTAPAAKPEKMEPEKEKVQMEELNKKLEEILKE